MNLYLNKFANFVKYIVNWSKVKQNLEIKNIELISAAKATFLLE